MNQRSNSRLLLVFLVKLFDQWWLRISTYSQFSFGKDKHFPKAKKRKERESARSHFLLFPGLPRSNYRVIGRRVAQSFGVVRLSAAERPQSEAQGGQIFCGIDSEVPSNSFVVFVPPRAHSPEKKFHPFSHLSSRATHLHLPLFSSHFLPLAKNVPCLTTSLRPTVGGEDVGKWKENEGK